MKLISYILLFSLLFSLLAKLQVCIGYIINQEYYAEVLCENKEEEDSCCKGKCAMEKELVKLTEKEEPQSSKNPGSEIKITKVEDAVMNLITFYPLSKFCTIINLNFEAKLKKGVSSILFKPPTV
ncbi:MAG: hypothetical protein Q8T03_03700 [Bacteroidota bacterium]|nr:hypothetical protein [Bacteroidota bacterium]